MSLPNQPTNRPNPNQNEISDPKISESTSNVQPIPTEIPLPPPPPAVVVTLVHQEQKKPKARLVLTPKTRAFQDLLDEQITRIRDQLNEEEIDEDSNEESDDEWD